MLTIILAAIFGTVGIVFDVSWAYWAMYAVFVTTMITFNRRL